jgi:hypothetical protein
VDRLKGGDQIRVERLGLEEIQLGFGQNRR